MKNLSLSVAVLFAATVAWAEPIEVPLPVVIDANEEIVVVKKADMVEAVKRLVDMQAVVDEMDNVIRGLQKRIEVLQSKTNCS